MKENKLSVFLCYLLRHAPDTVGLNMDIRGWVSVDELIKCVNDDGRYGLDRELLDKIVSEDEKGRYKYSEDGVRIKACQGHSLEWVEPELEYKEPPAVLYHGTTEKAFALITEAGEISRMKRHAVHLQAAPEKAWQSAERWHTPPVLLVIDAAAMANDGYTFGVSDNGVWCTEAVPTKYIKETVKK